MDYYWVAPAVRNAGRGSGTVARAPYRRHAADQTSSPPEPVHAAPSSSPIDRIRHPQGRSNIPPPKTACRQPAPAAPRTC